MSEIRTRYIIKVLTLDRSFEGISLYTWDTLNQTEILDSWFNHYGLKIQENYPQIEINVEYSNIK